MVIVFGWMENLNIAMVAVLTGPRNRLGFPLFFFPVCGMTRSFTLNIMFCGELLKSKPVLKVLQQSECKHEGM